MLMREVPPATANLPNPAKSHVAWSMCFSLISLLIMVLSLTCLVNGTARRWDSSGDRWRVDVSQPYIGVRNNQALQEVKGIYYQIDRASYFEREALPRVTLQARQSDDANARVTWIFLRDGGEPVSDTYGVLKSSPCEAADVPGKDCEFEEKSNDGFWNLKRAFLYATLDEAKLWFTVTLVGSIVGGSFVLRGVILVLAFASISKKFRGAHNAIRSNWHDAESVLVLPISEARVADFTEASLGPQGRRTKDAWANIWLVFFVTGPVVACVGLFKFWVRGLAGTHPILVFIGLYALGVVIHLSARLLPRISFRRSYTKECVVSGAENLIFLYQPSAPCAIFYRLHGVLCNMGSCYQVFSLTSLQQETDGWVFRCYHARTGQVEEFPLEEGQARQLQIWFSSDVNRQAAFMFSSHVSVELEPIA